MDRVPRDSERGLINKPFLLQIGLSGLIIGASAFLVFILFNWMDVSEAYAQTATFSFMALGQLAHVFNVRHPKTFGLDKSLFENKALVASLIAALGLLLIAVYIPFMQNVMGTEGLQLVTWGILLAGVAGVTLINYFVKKLIQNISE